MRREFSVRAARGVALLVLLLLAAATPGLAADSSKNGPSASPGTPVDLNSATIEALTTIPGIGEVMAQRIVDWREEHGPFRRVEDLMKVKGVGEKTFDKLRPYVKVGKSR
jgi:competence protein ComEA